MVLIRHTKARRGNWGNLIVFLIVSFFYSRNDQRQCGAVVAHCQMAGIIVCCGLNHLLSKQNWRLVPYAGGMERFIVV